MITVCTNKDMYIQKVFNNKEFTDLKTDIIVPADFNPLPRERENQTPYHYPRNRGGINGK